MNYFLFHKATDYKRGLLYGTTYEKGVLSTSGILEEEPGIFISRILDSREAETVWYRISLDFILPENTALEIRIFSGEEEQKEAVEEILFDAGLNGMEKLKGLEPFLKRQLHNKREALLNQIKGRYLWFALLLWNNGASTPTVSQIKLWFPWKPLTSMLPEVYGTEGSFLERYLAIFQTLYEEAEQLIRDFPASLDIGVADDDTLLWLSGWLSMDHIHLWPPKRLKGYLTDGALVYGGRGTKQGIRHMVHLYTGVMPYLMETEDRPGEFFLFITEKAIPTYSEYRALFRVINEVKPAHIEVNLICLKDLISLGEGSYLGINSVIQERFVAALGQMSQIGYEILGE